MTIGGTLVPVKRSTQTSRNIDFYRTLEFIERGDKIMLRFKRDALVDANYLIGMVAGGLFESTLQTALLPLLIGQNGWGTDANRTLELTVKDFEPAWFVGRMKRAIEMLEVVSRTRDLVDLESLKRTGSEIYFRFKLDGVAAIEDLYFLEDPGVMRLHWTGDIASGHLVLEAPDFGDPELLDYFVSNIVPHLEFLRD